MIDEQRTFEIYGYTSDELSPQSHKPIVVLCEECGRYRDLPKRDYHALCKSCATTKSWADPEARERRLDAIKKHWADMDTRKRQSDTQKKRYEDPTERKKLSNAQKKRYEDPMERTKTSDAGKKYFEDPEAHEKHSAALQGIPYDEWVAFASEQKYCPKFNNSMKQYIRDKYNNCDYISGIHKDVCNNYRNLDVHHIDYEKRQGCDEHEWRLIPLSRKNHMHTNGNRPFWNRLFTYALQYDETYYNEELILK